ncbi:hypothetical protein D3C85_1797260 [compost metagenome]
MVANIAAADVVRCQKKPITNMARMPGETKPVYSWIYWKPPFLSMPMKGAIRKAAIIDTSTVTRPIHTIFCSLAAGFTRFL